MLGNWIRQTTTSTGTGNLTLSSVSGFPTFANQFATTDYFYYTLLNDADGTPIESGIGHLSDSTTLVRDKPLATFVSSTYSDNDPSAVTLASGTKRVICSMEQGAALATPININTGAGSRVLYPTGVLVGESSVSAAMVDRRCVYVPILINTPRTIDAVMTRSSTITSGASYKLGIYSANLNGRPGTLIEQSALLTTDAAGIKTGTLTKRRYKPGLYFMAAAFNGTPAVNIPAFAGIVEPLLGGDASTAVNHECALYETLGVSWTSLPTTPNATLTALTQSSMPLLLLRLA